MPEARSYKVVVRGASADSAPYTVGSDDSSYTIHRDDSLGTVKRKISLALAGGPPVQTMYLYAGIRTRLSNEEVYRSLTMNGMWPLTKDRMAQFLTNVRDVDFSQLGVKGEYTYADLLSLGLEARDYTMIVPLDTKFVTAERGLPFAVDPFSALTMDPAFAGVAGAVAATKNGRLLMEAGPLVNDTIYVCLAGDVLAYSKAEGLSEEAFVSVYYPALHRSGIHNLEILADREGRLREESRSTTGPAFIRAARTVDLFYSLPQAPKRLPYVRGASGLSALHVLLVPASPFHMPLDIVFKLSRATSTTPFIKHNAAKGDPLYRLLSAGSSGDGRRVPSLRRPDLFRLARTEGRRRGVVAVSYPLAGDRTRRRESEVVCEFRRDGGIEITAMVPFPLSREEMVALMQKGSEPVLGPIRDYLAQRGYTIGKLGSLSDQGTVLLAGTYRTEISLASKPDVRSIRGCMPSVFVSVDGSGTAYRFRRVANYDRMTAQDGLIADMLRRNESITEIVSSVAGAFGIEEAAATEAVQQFLVGQAHGEQGSVDVRKVKVRSNPGLATAVEWDPSSSTTTVTVDGLDLVGYLETVPMYVDGLLRLGVGEKYIGEGQREQASQLCESADAELEPDRDVVSGVEDLSAPAPTSPGFGAVDSEAEAQLLDLMALDSDDEDEDTESEDENQTGGADGSPASEGAERDPTGLVLNDNRGNWALKRMRERDPNLFKIVKGSNTSYTRSCPWAARRVPVILTDAEKDKIDKEHPGSYDQAVRYGSPGNEKHWFICPRFWSLSKGTALSPDEVDPDRVIPEKTEAGKKVKKVPPGKDIIEFCSEGSPAGGRCTGEYRTKVPGFLNRRVDSDSNLCLPCCFDRTTLNKSHEARLRDCEKEMDDGSDADQGDGLCVEESPSNYIVETAKFGPTLRAGKLGFLSPTLQRFLGVDGSPCYAPGYGATLRKGDVCVVRKGVEQSRKQSFVACIASAWIDEAGRGEAPPCIKKMRSIMKDTLDLDRFVSLQNGALISIFGQDVTTKWPDSDLYVGSKLFKEARAKPPALESVRRAAVAYKAYRAFLDDDEVKMDHTYLWDLVCLPNAGMFPNGVNLAILEVPGRDATDNVRLLCPTNHYQRPLYDLQRPTLLIVRHAAGPEFYYEPIYVYKSTGRVEGVVTRRLWQARPALPSGLRASLERIALATAEGCTPLRSITYKGRTGLPLARLHRVLAGRGYEPTHQVLNYDTRVVGLGVRKEGITVVVPCEPSPPLIDLELPYTWVDELEEDLVGSMDSTVAALRQVANDSGGTVPSIPLVKVVEDGLVVGVITETDQFVRVTPSPPEEDGLAVLVGSSPASADREAMTGTGEDAQRVRFVRNLRLDAAFYRAYRDTVRVLLSRPEEARRRATLQSSVSDRKRGYSVRLDEARKTVVSLTKGRVVFTKYEDDALDAVGDIPGCLAEDACERHKSCRALVDGGCALAIPERSLVSGKSNMDTYPVRLADELVRYTRIREFMFKPERFLAFGAVRYDLGPDEMILPGALLTQDYFEDLIAVDRNRYADGRSYDTVQPLKTREYSETMQETNEEDRPLPPSPSPRASVSCPNPVPETKERVRGKWRVEFPSDCKELVYPRSPAPCTFQLFLDLCEEKKMMLAMGEVREGLATEYGRLEAAHRAGLIQAMRRQGKGEIADRLQQGDATMEDMSLMETYYATSLDYWILAKRFSLPLVLFSATALVETAGPVLVASPSPAQEYYYVKVPGKKKGKVSAFRLVARPSEKGGSLLPLKQLGASLQELVQADTASLTLDGYLEGLDSGGKKRVTRRVGRLRLQR